MDVGIQSVAEMTRNECSLTDLLAGVRVLELSGDSSVRVSSVCVDSRQVTPGALFVALPGEAVDGHRFVEQAVERGAVVAVVSEPVDQGAAPAVVRVPDTRAALARIAAAFYEHPSGHMSLVGITGTNGKTTLTYLLEAVLQAAGLRPGVIGTVEVRFAGRVEHNPHTTPQAHQLQELLARMRTSGVDCALIEVSSHGLALQRVRACHFRVAVFTNLSRDHLDFHGDLDSYAAAKRLLFGRELNESQAEDRLAVVNADDPASHGMLKDWAGPVIRFSLSGAGQVHPQGPVKSGLDGLEAELTFGDGTIALRSRLIGRHNLENLVCAVAVAHGLGIAPEAIEAGLAACERIPGRLDRVDGPGPAVFVDYAHTDHALTNVLAALRPLSTGRLVVVFGCGGDRDRGKRPLMGGAVAAAADLAVVTSDNPRSEDPAVIIDQILPGLHDRAWQRLDAAALPACPGRGYVVEADRRAAIRLAVGLADGDDVVLIAGKGHEDYQIVGAKRLDFDDRVEAQSALQLRKKILRERQSRENGAGS